MRADAERNRERILEAAADVFATAGLEATLHDVANRAGVGVGTVYRRFPDKQALVEALFDDKLSSLIDLARRASVEPDPWTGLAGFLRSMGAMQSESRGLQEVLQGSAYCQERAAEARSEFMPLIEKLLTRAQAEGVVRHDVTPADLSVVLLMVGSVAQYTQDARADLWERYLDLVLEGLRVHPDQRPFSTPPLTDEELFESMSTWHRLKR